MAAFRPHPAAYALAFALALGLAACQPEPEPLAQDAAADTLPPPEPEPRPADSADLDGTLRALEDDVTTMAPAAAVATIDGWIARLGGADFAERDAIVAGLRELREALRESPIDGARVGDILMELGGHTSEAGENAGDARVQRLGELLMEAGTRLSGG